MECPIQLAQENVDKAIFGKLTSVLSALVVHHHLMSPAQINLHIRTHTKGIKEKCQKIQTGTIKNRSKGWKKVKPPSSVV